jgi:hypothetical protein
MPSVSSPVSGTALKRIVLPCIKERALFSKQGSLESVLVLKLEAKGNIRQGLFFS